MKKIKIKSFNKSKVDSKLPYFLQSQKYAWEKFWQEDLKNLLEESSPIKDYTGKEYELWFLDYKLGEPNYPSDLEAKNNDDSFTAPLKVKVKLVNLKTKDEKTQEVFLTNFPLMTDRGTFVINGVERVVVSQLIRSPGVFFTSRISNGKKLFSAKIIPYRGSWLEFDTDSNGFVGVKIDRKRRVAATTLLRVFGLDTDAKIRQTFKDVDIDPDTSYIEKTLQRDPTKNQEEASLEIYSRLRPGDMANAEASLEFLGNMFFNFNRYDLSRVGRWKTNQRLPEISGDKKVKTITTKERVLTKEDIIATLREVIRLNNDPEGQADQIDHLGNRRVRTFTELLLNSLKIGMMRLERNVKDSMSTVENEELNPTQLINQRPIMASVRTFFSSSQLAQFMDQTNPLSELEHKREVISTGPGGLVRKRAGFEVRDVQPSHYGRICPIQTPDGPNVGLIGHIACYGRINDYGFLETPYIKVEDGKITAKVEYLDAYSEERYNIAPADILIDDNGKIKEKIVEARIKGKPGMIEKSEIDYIDVSPNQTISVAASLIPFLQNDDAKRASMGSNMQRQAVPLIKPDIPLVGTGLEEKVARDSGQVIIADFDGTIDSVDADHIKLKPEAESGHKTTTYELRKFVRTNQYTCFHQRPLVKKGQKVKKGDIIADGGSTKDGQLALGKNLLVAFVPWRGWNYEDAIVISERLVENDEFSSIHVESFNCDVRETKLGPEITTSDIPNVSEEKLKDLDEEGIIRVGAEVGPNDILVGKISPKGERDLTPEEELVQAIFGEKARDVKDTSLMMEHGKRGRVINVKVFERAKGYKLDPGVIKRIKIEIAQLRKIGAGDKLAGRHGNKGVISTVLPVEEMPYLEDGTPVDIVLNPLGIISRLNIGQILETHLGLAANKLGYVSFSPSLSGAKEIDVKAQLKEAGYPEDGKLVLFDGKTSEAFPEKCTVGYMYVLKLNHMVEDKLHMRSIGTYSLITQQPLGGKSQFGGQRFGEMEVWALEGYGAAYTLQEMLTIKSDDVVGRGATYNAILRNEEIKNPNIPASFNLLVSELKSLALDVEIKGKIIKDL
jgi:DNA-directed RNA polymerase subunit beta